MSATTSEGTGQGSVENIVPRLYSHQITREIEKIKIKSQQPPEIIDGGELKILSLLTEEEIATIIRASEILKKHKIN